MENLESKSTGDEIRRTDCKKIIVNYSFFMFTSQYNYHSFALSTSTEKTQ